MYSNIYFTTHNILLTTISLFVFFNDIQYLINPLHPKISMHILYTALYTFSKVLTKRICFDVNESDRRSNVHYLGSSENKA